MKAFILSKKRIALFQSYNILHMLKNSKHSIIVLLAMLLCQFCFSQTENRIDELINVYRDNNISFSEKQESLRNAYKIAENETNDSLRNKYLADISYALYRINDKTSFIKVNNEGTELAEHLEDSLTLAAHYWDKGSFYKKNKKLDSAYFFYDTAKKIYEKKGIEENVASILYNIGQIKKDVKDYTGSELSITNAIKIFEKLDDNRSLYNCYTILGIVFNNLEEYDKAIKYNNDALKYLKKTNKYDIREASTLNNIGVVYRNLNKHQLAVEKYNLALSFDSLLFKNPKLYAILTDNLAYSKFKLGDYSELPNLFYKSLAIRDSLNITTGIVINKLHLSEYYLSENDTVKSLKFSKEANKLAKKIKSYDHLLESYLLLAKIDTDKSTNYLKQYININDSLVKHERSIRDKFARIEFETDRYISQNEKLSIQNTWIVAISTAIIFFGFLIYIITQQRTRNKELEMEQQQQRANEEIYNLMIDQQDKIEEGRKREKERISLELHDGILGRLFGTRLSLGSLNAKDDNDSKKVRQQYINELQSIEEEVRNISHELGLDNFDKSTSYSTMITNLLEEQSKITNFKYQIEDDDRIIWTDIPGHIKINIYRIIQESIQNINKYAQAENVILDFKKNDNRIILTIKDDGVGFDQDKRSSGIGLKNMKSRVTLLHGQFTINSIPGKGTSISVDVPMT